MKRNLKSILKKNKTRIYQICFTFFTVIMTTGMPIVNYINFKTLLNSVNCPTCPNLSNNQINLGGLEATYDILIYFFIVFGITISVCAYLIFRFQKYSVRRGILLLAISIMYLISTIASSQLSIIFVEVAKVQIITDFSGVYILLTIIMTLYIFKNLFDLIDFKINQSYYSTILRKKRTAPSLQKKFRRKLDKCPKCKYMCRIGWKKCPICKTKI